MSISLDLVIGRAADPSLWHAIVSDPKNLLPAVGTVVTIIGVIVSAATFAITQRLQRKINRAEAIQDLVEWFSKRRAEDTQLRPVAKALAYGPSFTFTQLDLNTEKEAGLAVLLSSLNHICFYVDVKILTAKDVARTETGYYFLSALKNPDVLGYLSHTDDNDKRLRGIDPNRKESAGDTWHSFFYLREHGPAIAGLACPEWTKFSLRVVSAAPNPAP